MTALRDAAGAAERRLLHSSRTTLYASPYAAIFILLVLVIMFGFFRAMNRQKHTASRYRRRIKPKYRDEEDRPSFRR